MLESLPGFRGTPEVSQLVTAAILLVVSPLVGWLAYRIVARKLSHTHTLTDWGGDKIVLAAIQKVLIVWFWVAGAWIALSVLRFQRAVPDENIPSRPGLRIPIAEGIERFLIAVLIFSATMVLARVAADVIKLYSLRSAGTTRSASLFIVISKVIAYTVGLLILLQTLGVQVTPLLGALGVGGLAVALAMQDTLVNFFAGLQIIATKKVKPGDFIRLDSGEEGYVVDIDWRHTSIRQLPNNMVLVPNSRLIESIITNFYYPEREMSVRMQVGVSYDSDLDHVERVTIEVAREVLSEVEGGVPSFEPFIRYHTFNDFSIDFSVILRAQEFVNQYLITHEFVKRLKKRYDAEGIVIPFPIRTIDWPQAIEEGFGNETAARRFPPQRRAGS